jgi:hypothetical protein
VVLLRKTELVRMNLKNIVRILFIFCTIVTKATSYKGNLPTSQTDVLLSLYYATFGPYWKNIWPIDNATSDPCEWYGVSCSTQKMTVLELQLNYNNLQGSIPASLGNLSNLKELNLN